MYLRHSTKRTKDGPRTYWTLVRSVRRGSKVVQETVANLGRLDATELREAAAIARHFLGTKADQLDLFEDHSELSPKSRAGLGNSPRTLLEELKRIQCVDVVIPIVDGPELRLRCVVEPDEELASLLDRMGLRLPKRLRAPQGALKM